MQAHAERLSCPKRVLPTERNSPSDHSHTDMQLSY